MSAEEELASRVEEHVGDRGLSGFVARAVAHELERDSLTDFLDELDDEFGAAPVALIEPYEAQWPS